MGSVLALGAWLKNAACLRSADGRVRWSAVHGDLGTPQACAALEASAEALLEGETVDAVAHDLHPDFHSTRLAQALAARLGVPAVGVQHHHAHIGVVMAEHDLHEPVVGLALDGVGLGTDGTAWGGEVLVVGPTGWRRAGHLFPLRLPGGDLAAREPWRMAAAALHAMGRGGEIATRFDTPLARGVTAMLDKRLNCPLSTSAGRWFDAAAAALGLSAKQTHEAEAAMALEAAATAWLQSHALPPFDEWVVVDRGVIDLRPLLARLFETRDAGEGAALFHAVLAEALVRAAAAPGPRTVALGGGCFLNRLLTERVATGLAQRGLHALLPKSAGCGDAGLALGQAWVAAQELETAACV